MEIRYVNSQDIEAITNIYNDFVVNSTATFEEKPVTTEEMSQRVGKIQSYSLPCDCVASVCVACRYSCCKPRQC